MERNASMIVPHPARKWQCLNATTLKLIAVVLMFLDHIHQMFVHVGAPMWLTMMGRLVFPIFLFTAAESFYYTRSKKKYLQRLLVASCGMTLFTVILQLILPNDHVVLMNNAFSTFFVAVWYMLSWEMLVAGVRHRKTKQIFKAILCGLVPILSALPLLFVAELSSHEGVPFVLLKTLITLALMIPNLLAVEGGAAMVALGVGFYIFRKHRAVQIALLLMLSAVVYLSGDHIQWMMGFAALPIALYNGERGKGMKSFFYVFYPLHIGLLYVVSTILCGS